MIYYENHLLHGVSHGAKHSIFYQCDLPDEDFVSLAVDIHDIHASRHCNLTVAAIIHLLAGKIDDHDVAGEIASYMNAALSGKHMNIGRHNAVNIGCNILGRPIQGKISIRK